MVWLYTPVVRKGNTKKFSSFWKGPYTIVDKVGPVNYKIQLVGGTQSLVVHRNRIKLCYNVEQCSPQPNLACSRAPLYSPVGTGTGVAGHVTLTHEPVLQSNRSDVFARHLSTGDTGHSSTSNTGSAVMNRPVRTHRPPQRYNDFISH